MQTLLLFPILVIQIVYWTLPRRKICTTKHQTGKYLQNIRSKNKPTSTIHSFGFDSLRFTIFVYHRKHPKNHTCETTNRGKIISFLSERILCVSLNNISINSCIQNYDVQHKIQLLSSYYTILIFSINFHYLIQMINVLRSICRRRMSSFISGHVINRYYKDCNRKMLEYS